MFDGKTKVPLIVLSLLVAPGLAVFGSPIVTIQSPGNNTVLAANSVNITGTASGSDAQWVQTDKADFDAGVTENATSNVGGNVSLNESVYDDFNDNTLDSGRWSYKGGYGVAVSEQNGRAVFSGKSTTGSTWGAVAEMTSTQVIASWVSADLVLFSGTGTGYNADIMLNQDPANEAGLAFHFDTGYGPNPTMYWTQWIGGVVQITNLGAMTACPHNVRLVLSGGTLSIFLDGSLLRSSAVNLANTKVHIYSGAKSSGDTFSVNWDNIKSGISPSGAITSSIYDTMSSDPVLKKVCWTAETPSGTGVSVQLRSCGNQDMSSPTSWVTVSNNQTSGLPAVKRYLQYKATLTSADGLSIPVFKDMTVDYRKPVKKVEVSVDGKATWMDAIGTEEWHALIELPENQSTIWVRATDVAGDTSETSVSVDVDTTPPTGYIKINSGDEFATGRNVNITCSAKDKYGVAKVIVSQDRLFGDADWTDYSSSIPFTLSGGDGQKTVYAKFRDSNGLESSVVNDSIVLDTAPPKGTIMIDDGAKYTRNLTVTLSLNASDASGVEDMKLSDYKDLAGADWQPYKTVVRWDLQPGSGERGLYVVFRSTIGQESAVASDTIILDTLPPTMSVAIGGGAEYTNNTSVSLLLNATDNYRIASVELSNDPAFAAAAPEQYTEQKSWSLSPGDGPKTVYARATDAAGNTGKAGTASITLDTTPPACSISPLPLTVNTTDFGVNWTGTDPASGVAFFDVQYCDGGGPWTDWLLHTNLTRATFSGSDGHDYSFRARAQDRAGNQGDYPTDGSTQVQVRLPPPPKPPVVAIARPMANATLKRNAEVTGTSHHPDAGMSIRRVTIRIDGGPSQQVNGTSSWSYTLDTTSLADGRHSMSVQAFDGTRYSDNATLDFNVDNPRGEPLTSSGDFWPWLAVVVAVVIVMASVAMLASRRKRMQH